MIDSTPSIEKNSPAALTRWGWLAVVIMVFAGLCVLSLQKIHDFDYWNHLYFGRQFLTEWSLLDFGRYSLTAPAQQWPFRVLLYQAYTLQGHTLVSLLIAGLFAAALACLLIPAKAEPWPTLLVRLLLVMLAAKVALVRLMPRPELLGYLLFALALLALASWMDRPRPSRLVILAALLLAWYPTHQTFYIGAPFLLAVPLVLNQDLNLRTLWRKRSRISVLVALAIIACLAVSGWFAYYVFERLTGGGILTKVSEMRPTWVYSHILRDYLILTGATAVLCWLSCERRWRLLLLLVPVFLVGLVVVRNVAMSAVAMLFLGGWALRDVPWRAVLPRWQTMMTVILLLANLGFAAWMVSGRVSRWGVGLRAGTAPVEAARFVLDHKLQGPVFNNLDCGSFLLWAWQNQPQHFLDGRLVGKGTMEDHALLIEAKQVQTLFEKHGIHTVLLQPYYWNDGRIFPLVTRLMFDPRWTLVHASDALVFVDRLPEGMANIPQQEGWRAIYDLIVTYGNLTYTGTHLDFSRGIALQGMGRFAEAQAAFANGAQHQPELVNYYKKIINFDRRQ